jgi:hypothetical protein
LTSAIQLASEREERKKAATVSGTRGIINGISGPFRPRESQVEWRQKVGRKLYREMQTRHISFFLPLVASFFFPGAWNPEGGEMKGIPRWKKRARNRLVKEQRNYSAKRAA